MKTPTKIFLTIAGLALSVNAQTSLTLLDSIVVSDETTQSALGAVDSGTSEPFAVRSRGNNNDPDRQVVSFFQFDVSSLTEIEVNDPSFSATFQIDYTSKLGTGSTEVGIGRNAGGAWDSGGSNYPLHEWGWNIGDGIVTAADGQFLVDLSSTAPTVTGLTADVTTIVQDWVTTGNGIDNNGLVLYYNSNEFIGGGFDNPQLTVIPEPSSIALLGLAGLAGALFFRRRR